MGMRSRSIASLAKSPDARRSSPDPAVSKLDPETSDMEYVINDQ